MLDFLRKKAEFASLVFVTDWHCHLLPGVDDGVESVEESVAILRRMYSEGVRTVVHTPHFNSEIYPSNNERSIRDAFDRYLDALPHDITDRMEMRLAGEYMLTDGFERRDVNSLLTLDSGKVLIEMSYLYPSANLKEVIFNIRLEGLTPVLAHPERYLYFAGNPGIFDELHGMGAEFQLNLLSLGGVYGPSSVRIMEHLLEKGWYACTGTDTHSGPHFEKISALRFRADYLRMLLR